MPEDRKDRREKMAKEAKTNANENAGQTES